MKKIVLLLFLLILFGIPVIAQEDELEQPASVWYE